MAHNNPSCSVGHGVSHPLGQSEQFSVSPHDFPHYSAAHVRCCDWYCLASTLSFKVHIGCQSTITASFESKKHQDSEGKERKYKSAQLSFQVFLHGYAAVSVCLLVFKSFEHVCTCLRKHIWVFWLLNTIVQSFIDWSWKNKSKLAPSTEPCFELIGLSQQILASFRNPIGEEHGSLLPLAVYL